MNVGSNRDVRSEIVFIVDDEETSRTSLQRFLKSYGYETEAFGSAAEFLKRPMREELGCLILDYQMPEMNGIELQQELVNARNTIPIIFLSAHGSIPVSVKAMKSGAEDFLPKMAEDKELLDAIERALCRARKSLDARQGNEFVLASAKSLTVREHEVCRFVISGMLNKQIASKLGITERTVKAHRAKVMKKFAVVSVADLVRSAAIAGIPLAE